MFLLSLQGASLPNPNDDAMTIATVVIAAATVAYFITTFGLWLTTRQSVNLTRKIFEESNRPRVGAIQAERKADVYSPNLQVVYAVTYINAGSTTAHDVQTSIDVFVDGVKWAADEHEEEPSQVLLSNFPYTFERVIEEQSKINSIEKASTLSLIFKCSYKGTAGRYYGYEQKYTVNANGGFTPVRGTAT